MGKKVFETVEQLEEAMKDSEFPLKDGQYVVLNGETFRICRPTTEKRKKIKFGMIFWRKGDPNDFSPAWDKVVSFVNVHCCQLTLCTSGRRCRLQSPSWYGADWQ